MLLQKQTHFLWARTHYCFSLQVQPREKYGGCNDLDSDERTFAFSHHKLGKQRFTCFAMSWVPCDIIFSCPIQFSKGKAECVHRGPNSFT